MKIAYAFRRTTVYPYTAGFYGPAGWGLPDEPGLTTFLKKINEIGFDGIELGFEVFAVPQHCKNCFLQSAKNKKKNWDLSFLQCYSTAKNEH